MWIWKILVAKMYSSLTLILHFAYPMLYVVFYSLIFNNLTK